MNLATGAALFVDLFIFLFTFAARVHFQPVPHYTDCILKVTC